MIRGRSLHRSIVAIAAGAIALLSSLPAHSQPADISLNARFSPNPLEVRGTGGGATPIQEILGQPHSATGECTGFASRRPDHTLVLTSGFKSLSLTVQSTEDTALAIRGPGGIWCNDDFQGKNPGIAGEWLPGTYTIWISAYAKNRAPAYTLRIQEHR